MKLTFAEPPEHDEPDVLSDVQIAEQLKRRPNKWAIVASHDRYQRALHHSDRIGAGLYGENFESLYRQVGRDHRVYARYLKP